VKYAGRTQARVVADNALRASLRARSLERARLVLLGLTAAGRLVVVAHTDRGETVRLISARLATPGERRRYEQTHEE
jgi:uncharacterized DUF497 family protein